jgi:hypothetical protein
MALLHLRGPSDRVHRTGEDEKVTVARILYHPPTHCPEIGRHPPRVGRLDRLQKRAIPGLEVLARQQGFDRARIDQIREDNRQGMIRHGKIRPVSVDWFDGLRRP